MEIYLSNNCLEEIREIKSLKHLNKLIILDLSGNQLSKDPNYRIFTIFHTRKLKVLNGMPIEPNEQQVAREMFVGRLTEDILENRLNGKSLKDIKELDLSNCRLRDFDDIFTGRNFPRLRELNLSGNYFSSMRIFGQFPTLKVLSLNSNRIESLIITNNIHNMKKSKHGLNGLKNLETLDLSNNKLKDLSGLQFCVMPTLKILKLENNMLSKIENIKHLVNLKELDVSRNKIRALNPYNRPHSQLPPPINPPFSQSFSSKMLLKCLKIDNNGLKSFPDLGHLTKLTHLFANQNRLSDYHDLDKLKNVLALKELELTLNPVSRRVGYRNYMIRNVM